MKKLFVAAVALLFINSLDAQVRFGMKAGGNLANLDDFNKSKMKLGVNAGPIFQIDFAKLFFVQPELLYSLKGTQSTATPSGNNAIINLNYINLPVLFGFRAAQNLSVKLGPELGYLLSAKAKFEGSTNDISNIYRDFDFGADLGLACQLKKLSVELRYNYGLKKLVHLQLTDAFGFPLWEEEYGSNRVLQFSLCYFLK